MKKTLLILIAAVLVAVNAQAQAWDAKNLLSPNALTNKVSLVNSPKMSFEKRMPASRFSTPEEKDLKELSYFVPPFSSNDVTMVPIVSLGNSPMTVQWICQYPASVTSQFVGNVATTLYFIAPPATYSTPTAFIYDVDTHEMVWAAKFEDFEEEAENTIECDYAFTGHTIWVGVMDNITKSKKKDAPAAVSVPAYPSAYGAGCVLGIYGGTYNLSSGYASWPELLEYEYLTEETMPTSIENYPAYLTNYIVLDTEGENGYQQLNASLVGAEDVRGQVNSETETMLYLQNAGLETLQNFSYTYQVGDKQYSDTYTFKTPLEHLGSVMVPVKALVPSTEGRHTGAIALTAVNGKQDPFADDNLTSLLVTGWEKGFPRNLVVEEFTSTSCGWCPRGFVGLEKAAAAGGDRVIPVAVHTLFDGDMLPDPFVSETYEKVLDEYAYYFPSCSFNREEHDLDPYYGTSSDYSYDVTQDVARILATNCEAQMEVGSTVADGLVTATAKVVLDIPAQAGSYGVAFALMEDGLTGVDQLNYYYNYSSPVPADLKFLVTEMTGTVSYNNKQYPVYQPTFNHVGRHIVNPFGTEKALGAVHKGFYMSEEATFALPTGVVPANCTLAAYLIDLHSGVIVTGAQSKLGTTPDAIKNVTTSGTHRVDFFSLDGRRVNNPAKGGVYIQRVGNESKKVLF